MKLILLISLGLFSHNSLANFQINPICDAFNEDIPVQAGGRVKPFYVLAKDTLKFISPKAKKLAKLKVTDVFCTMMTNPSEELKATFPILIEHIETKKLLGLSENERFIGATELVNKESLLRSQILKLKENNSFKKDLNKTYSRLDTFKKIINGDAFTVYSNGEWKKINELSVLQDDQLVQMIKLGQKKYIEKNGDDYLLELTYVKSHIFSYTMIIVLLGIFLTVLTKSLKAGVFAAVLVILIEIAAMTMRIMISGRAPITNMYETVMFSGFGALVVALIILIFKREKIFLLAGLGYNLLCLFMMMFANNMLSSSISPLVPVLRDNFWLSTHVTTIILSYAALALTWLVANITLVKMRVKGMTKKDYRYHENLIYTCMKVGVVLLSAGIILGGVWADYSWGRFWGWDPKETWSLIVFLFYIAIMHGKYSNWIDTHRFVLLASGGFMTVMMAWFGVNYILASGLHSYGFSEGGAIFLGTFFIIQTILLIICGAKRNFITK